MNENILIVHDDSNILDVMKIVLLQEGYLVTTALKGKTAAELISRKAFALVVTDLRIPDMDKTQLILDIKNKDPAVEVIVLNSHAEIENQVMDLKNHGVSASIEKPIKNTDKLLSKVKRSLDKRRLKLENRELVKTLKKTKQQLLLQNKALKEAELLKQAMPVSEDKGFIIGLLGITNHIPEQERSQKELIRMAKLDSLGTLAGGIAHDFNNLLTVIMGYIEIAKLDLKHGITSARALKEAEKGCLAAKELTTQFITFSRGGDFHKELCDIGPILRDTVHFSLSGSKVKEKFSISKDLYSTTLDKKQFGLVIHNLVQNAIDAMPRGGSLEIKATNTKISKFSEVSGIPYGRYIRLEIQDEGTGILKENISRVFDPYFSTKDRGSTKGMGLGLSTAFSIIKKHNGFIFLASTKDMGTTVSIYLPAFVQVKKDDNAAMSSDAPRAKPPLKSLRILVMDDEPALRKIADQMLQKLGHETVMVKDGNEAMEAYRQSMGNGLPFDLIILDLTVKGGPGGKEIIADLVKLNPKVRAIVCSGHTDDPVLSNCEEYGFCTALAKPFHLASLDLTIKDAIRHDIFHKN